MRTKYIFSSVLAAMMVAACSNEEIVDSSNLLNGKMMDASNFALVGGAASADASTRVSYLPQYVYVDNGAFKAGVLKPTWEAGDAIGFSHIYDSDQQIVTNYKFDLDPLFAGTSDGAKFHTENSTIFEGDYFVYYPFNENYADYKGIPFALDAVQVQDASAAAIVKVGMKPGNGIADAGYATDAAEIAALTAAGAHLKKFSISNRIEAEAQVNQAEFVLNQFTSTLAFLIYPKNQTQNIYIKRVEMVSANATPLAIPVSVRFKSQGKTVAAPAIDDAQTEKEEKAILLFENVDGTNGGLKVVYNGTKESASLGYMSMLPNTYAQGSYKFVVYYTENSILKKIEVAGYKDLKMESNKTTFFNLELNSNGAVEATTDYDIYTETEFASAVAKSNAVTNGELEFNIVRDITLNDNYELKSAVPVTFKGGKTLKIAEGKTLKFNSDAKIVMENILSADETMATFATAEITKGDVTIKGVNSKKLHLTNNGKTVIKNEGARGALRSVTNATDNSNLTLENVDVDYYIYNGPYTGTSTKAILNLKNAVLGSEYMNNSSSTTASTLENVTVKGNFTNAEGKLNVTGTNVLAYKADAPVTINNFSTADEINFTNTTTTLGNVAFTTTDGVLNIAKGDATNAATLTAKGTTALANGFVYVDAKGTYNAEDDLTGLKGDGSIANSTMILEGTLTTNATADLADNFKFCGTIENKADGEWVLDTYGVYKFDHAHLTAPVFKNAGFVEVKNVDDEAATAAMNKLAKDLYSAESTGTLMWSGITTLENMNDIVALADDCWATDLKADLTGANDLTGVTLKDWSRKNIHIAVANGVAATATLTATQQIKAKNLNIVTSNSGTATTFIVTYPGTGKAFNVTETLTLKNEAATANGNEIDIKSAICKDIVADNVPDFTFIIDNGLSIEYTGTYKTSGKTAKVSYPNNIPQLKN